MLVALRDRSALDMLLGGSQGILPAAFATDTQAVEGGTRPYAAVDGADNLPAAAAAGAEVGTLPAAAAGADAGTHLAAAAGAEVDILLAAGSCWCAGTQYCKIPAIVNKNIM